MSRAGAWLKQKAPGLHRFMTRRDKPWPLVREIVIGILGILLVVVLLFGLTGQPVSGGYPVVVVTSGSMMHCGNGYHVLGKDCDPVVFAGLKTIDPGDLVFVRKVTDRLDIDTAAKPGASWHYDGPGDIIVYRPNGSTETTPIIHRALFWVQVNEDGTYSVPELGIQRVSRLNDERLVELAGCQVAVAHSQAPPRPEQSGFVTRGDNNNQGGADQCSQYQLVRMEWVLGKARGELPWIGLVKLFFDDLTQDGPPNFANANGESKFMLVVVIVVLVGGPWAYDMYARRRHRRRGGKADTSGGGEAEPEPGEKVKAEPSRRRR